MALVIFDNHNFCWSIKLLSDPTRAYFWPAVKKGPTWPWPGNFLTWTKEIFLIRQKKNCKISSFWINFSWLRESWPNPIQVKKLVPKPISADWQLYSGNIFFIIHYFWLEMGPEPTRAYFWPTVSNRPACLWPDKRFFLTWRGKNWKILHF